MRNLLSLSLSLSLKHELLKQKIEEINQSSDNFIFNASDLKRISKGKYTFNSLELQAKINAVIREKAQPEDNFYTIHTTVYLEKETDNIVSPYGKDYWIAIKKDKLYQIAKESSNRYSGEILNFKDKIVVIITYSLKWSYPNTFNDVDDTKFEEIKKVEDGESEKTTNEKYENIEEVIRARCAARKEIEEKLCQRDEDGSLLVRENDLGFEYLELFFNNNCVCDEPGYYWHLLDDCLKSKEQVEEFKNKVIQIIDAKAQENRNDRNKRRGDSGNSNSNTDDNTNNDNYRSSNDSPPQFNDNHDPLLGNFKTTVCQEIIRKTGEIAIRYKIHLLENDLLAEANYKNCFGHSSCFNDSLSFMEHIWDCLNNREEIKTFKEQIISVMEQIYREKSSSSNSQKFSEEEIKEKVVEEEQKQWEENQKNKTNYRQNLDKNQNDEEKHLAISKNHPPPTITKNQINQNQTITSLLAELLEVACY